MQMDRASKRQKTIRLRNLLPHCSASAFAAFCAAAKRGELPTISTRKEVRDARDDNVDVTTPFGPLLTKLEITSASGKAIIYDGVHPLPYLYCAAQKKNFGTQTTRERERESSLLTLSLPRTRSVIHSHTHTLTLIYSIGNTATQGVSGQWG